MSIPLYFYGSRDVKMQKHRSKRRKALMQTRNHRLANNRHALS